MEYRFFFLSIFDFFNLPLASRTRVLSTIRNQSIPLAQHVNATFMPAVAEKRSCPSFHSNSGHQHDHEGDRSNTRLFGFAYFGYNSIVL